ncbi:serine hydrolase domain-containing protein [Algibacter mikhailovii]|uniref:Beta-lactamase-related domain-containing protein n=1 Tax=Algibacter mikhailovii TaxID=425498 RepID=A0A918REX2_9FLAO|nr:serine hydrolase domain-containing protein [Algibacter mikhailovii]GGZ95368.1 hypothetical protein GCM10007028_36630 [Algibacter mikhailovii]
MKKYFLLLFLISFTVYSFGQIKESQAIDSIFTEWNKTDVPGCALGIIKEGKLIYARGYGMANMEYDIPNSASSVFRIGSTSKQFTAACIVLLTEQRKLNLEDKLNSFFPDFPEYAKNITIQNLLNHTSGIRDYLTISYLKGYGDDEYYEDDDIMNWLINQSELNFNSGDEFLYSNSGYWLLGQIVNKVSGMSMADFANKEIFSPLGMSNTHFHNNHKQIVKNRASGYLPTDDESYEISMTTLDMIGDGGIFTTINDIKKWDDEYYYRNVLSNEFWTLMTKQGVLNNGEVIDYASGLDIGNYKGLKTISHGGAFVGFRAELVRFPENHFSVAIFANRGDANPTGMAYQVADIILKEDFKDIKVSNNKEIEKQEFINIKTSELKKFEGHYWNVAGSYSRKIYVKNDTLRYYRSETNESKLVPISKNEFKMIDVGVDVIIKFENEHKNQTMSVIIYGGKPINSEVYIPKKHTIEELKSREGTYYSKELNANYSLKIEDGSLMLYVNGTKTSPLKSIMENLFSNNDYGTFEFVKKEAGKDSGFRLAAGRVKNLEFKKK